MSISPRVMFLTTSNSLYSIPPALLDRMEIIRLPGYLELREGRDREEFPDSQRAEANGLEPKDIQISDGAIKTVINAYTLEAGVRSLEREIAASLPQGGAQESDRQEGTQLPGWWRSRSPSTSACRSIWTARSRSARGWAWRRASPGPRREATS